MQNSVTLGWDASTDPSVAGYKLYYGPSSRNYTNSINAGTATSATLVNMSSGVTYYFAATTYNTNNVESAYSSETTFAVGSTSSPPPTLDPLTNVVVSENAGLKTVNLTGISSGSTNSTQTLTVTAFSSDPTIVPNPTVNYTSPNTTGSLTFAPATNAFGQVTMTVMVDNGNTVSNTVIRSFSVTVNPVNNPPTLNPLSNLVLSESAGQQTVNLTGISSGATNEIQPLTIVAVSSNPLLIPNPTVNYTSPNAAGTLSFTPVANMFGGATITVSVSDGQPTNSSTAQSFVVNVNQVIAGPAPITNVIMFPNTAFRLPLTPPFTNNDQISYSLSSAPTGARIMTRKGVSYLVWSPTSLQASSTNNIIVVVNDSTTPALSTNEVVRIIVLDYLNVGAGSTSVQAGQSTTLPLYMFSSDSLTNLAFSLGWPTNRFSTPTLSVGWPGITSNSVTLQGTNLVIRLQAPSQPMQGSNFLAQLSFQTLTNQRSSFVPVPVNITTAVKAGGLLYSNTVPAAGRVVLVSDVPLLEPYSPGARILNLYGKVGAKYQLLFCTNLVRNASWYPVMNYTQTNVVQPAAVTPPAAITVYRLLQQ